MSENDVTRANVCRRDIPVASTRTVLLDLLGVGIGKPRLGKETREILGRGSSPLSEALVVTVVGLVGASH